MLLLADRGFFGVDLRQTAAATGADLLWRVRKDVVLAVVEQLPDGSYISEIFDQRDIQHTPAKGCGCASWSTPSQVATTSIG
jgi:hypothetical protein